MKKLIIALTVVALLLGVISCSAAPKAVPPSNGKTGGSGGITVPGPAPVAPGAPDDSFRSNAGTSESTSTATTDRLIVRTGNVDLVVKDVVESRDKVAALAANLGGFVVSSQIVGRDEGMRGFISIRIPAASFDQAMTALRGYSVRVNSESSNSQDVTEQFTDLQARLKTAQATEEQYLTIMQRATTVEDTLKVLNSLNQIRTQIEQLQGQIQFIERTTSMSIISVQLSPETSAKPLVTGWNFGEIVKSAIRGLTTTAQAVASVLIWVVILAPLWGIALVVVWLVRRRKKNG